jgi:DNA polymerase III alpha subunit (gram-positive type)
MMVFDIETDGLNPSKIHCLSYTTDGKEYNTVTHHDDMRQLLWDAKGLIGHNILRYDIPVLERLLYMKIKARLYDTLPMSWVINYERGKHGLATFGEEFGIPKPVVTDWTDQDIQVYIHRCEEDVKINSVIFRSR